MSGGGVQWAHKSRRKLVPHKLRRERREINMGQNLIEGFNEGII